MVVALVTCPAMLATAEAIRQGQSKDKREEHRARRCNLVATCVRASRRSREIDGRRVVLRDNKVSLRVYPKSAKTTISFPLVIHTDKLRPYSSFTLIQSPTIKIRIMMKDTLMMMATKNPLPIVKTATHSQAIISHTRTPATRVLCRLYPTTRPC